MQTSNIPRPGSPVSRIWLLAVAVAVGAAGIAWFIATDASYYFYFDLRHFTPYYWPRRYGLLMHIGGGMLALGVGLIQVWLGMTGRTQKPHRYLGRIYLGAVTVGCAGAFYLAIRMPPPATYYTSGLFGLAVAWAITTSAGYRSIRQGHLLQHREWMIRSYVVTFGFVTFRIITTGMGTLGIGTEDSRSEYAAWLCWTVPLLVAEVFLRWNKRRVAGMAF